MEFIKKNLKTIIIVVIILAVVCYFLCKKKDESSYAKCLCKGVRGPGGAPYYNFHCCGRASAATGKSTIGVA